MDWQTLILQPEGERLEFKRDASSPEFLKKAMSTLCAFANNINQSIDDAYFLMGVDDQGVHSGFRDSNQDVEEKIRHSIMDTITPRLKCEIKVFREAFGDIVLVRVSASNPYVYQYKKQVYFRLGSSTLVADKNQIGQLIHQKRGGAKDNLPVLQAPIEAIDPIFFAGYQRQCVGEEILRENHRPYEEQLAQQGFYDFQHQAPTLAGILMCGAEPQKVYTESIIDYQRYTGETVARNEMINRQTLKGNLMQQWQALELLLQNMVETWYESTPSNFSSLRETQSSSYPLLALRELAINALVHRDYQLPSPIQIRQFADRVVIVSPGGLTMPAQPDNFPNRAAYRNPLIMSAFQRLSWVERAGSGVAFANAQLIHAGQAPAKFNFNDTSFVEVIVTAKVPKHQAFIVH